MILLVLSFQQRFYLPISIRVVIGFTSLESVREKRERECMSIREREREREREE